MKKVIIGIGLVLGLALALPEASWAAKFYINEADKCFEIVQRNIINPYFIIYKCTDCGCANKVKEAVGFESMAEAMRYLEKKYGELDPR
ncbi:MAG: hypothetical protein AB1641_11395 [Thermodesulfobacteriota bacterium]